MVAADWADRFGGASDSIRDRFLAIDEMVAGRSILGACYWGAWCSEL
jgi:hypothetical protein